MRKLSRARTEVVYPAAQGQPDGQSHHYRAESHAPHRPTGSMIRATMATICSRLHLAHGLAEMTTFSAAATILNPDTANSRAMITTSNPRGQLPSGPVPMKPRRPVAYPPRGRGRLVWSLPVCGGRSTHRVSHWPPPERRCLRQNAPYGMAPRRNVMNTGISRMRNRVMALGRFT